MATSSTLRRLDDRVLSGPGVRSAAGVVVRVSQLVLLALAISLLLAVVFVVLPVNEGNDIVSADLALADQVAGPLRDVFAFDDRALRAAANYGLAAALYLVVAKLLGRLRP